MGFPPRYRNGDSSWCQNPESNDRGRGDQGFCVTFALDVSEHLSCQAHDVHDDDAVSDEPAPAPRSSFCTSSFDEGDGRQGRGRRALPGPGAVVEGMRGAPCLTPQSAIQ